MKTKKTIFRILLPWLAGSVGFLFLLVLLLIPGGPNLWGYYQQERRIQMRAQVKTQVSELTLILENYPFWQEEYLKQPQGYSRTIQPMLAQIQALPQEDELIREWQQWLAEVQNPYTGQSGPEAVFGNLQDFEASPAKEAFNGRILYKPVACSAPERCRGFQLHIYFGGGQPGIYGGWTIPSSSP